MILTTAQATGARALQDGTRVSKYLANDPDYPRTWTREQLAKAKPQQLQQQADVAAAVEKTSQMLLELTDIFCMNRDFQYQSRSRRWLYTRGYASRLRSNYERWVAFIHENPTHDNAGLVNADPKSLENLSMNDLLDLVPGQSKSNRALGAYQDAQAKTAI